MNKTWSLISLIWMLMPVLGISTSAYPSTSLGKPANTSVITHPIFMCGSGRQPASAVDRPSFESIASRPLALSDDGTLLFATNTVANCLEIFDVRGNTIKLLSSVSVGVDPVSVQVRNTTEVWVVNHLSDSVSIVDIEGTPHVKETLPVGDEPWDIVFADRLAGKQGAAGNRKNRAFISTAFRGQSDPQFKTQYLYQKRFPPGSNGDATLIGRANLWVLDIDGQTGRPALSGAINLFTDSVRSLAVSKDGSRVYAASFKSGNRTAAIDVGFDDLLLEKWSSDGVGNPEPRLIVQQQGNKWLDEFGRDWSDKTGVTVADNDLFVIDSTQKLKLGNPDHPESNRDTILKTVQGIGTVLFNIEASDKYLFVSGLDARNTVATENRLKGNFVNNILAIIDIGNDYSTRVKTLNGLQIADSDSTTHPTGTALPTGMAVVGDSVYLATMGGNNILALNPGKKDEHLDEIPAKALIDFSNGQQPQSDGGPLGLKADLAHKRLFVYTRFDNKISVYTLDTVGASQLVNAYGMFDGEKEPIRQGRRYFYDANLTSGNGNGACASCHIFGGTDKLQWDLSKTGIPLEMDELPFLQHADPAIGNLKTTLRTIRLKADPATVKVGDTLTLGNRKIPVIFKGNKQEFASLLDAGTISLERAGLAYLDGGTDEPRLEKFDMASIDHAWIIIDAPFFHPLKGPMLTLPLYGIADSGPMHFRGDVQGRLAQNGMPCGSVENSVEQRALDEFNAPCDGTTGAFESLLGGKRLDDGKMKLLGDFLLSLSYPPNPVRPLDNTYSNERGAKIFFNELTMADVKDHRRLVDKQPTVFHCVDCHTLDRQNRKFGTSKVMYSAPTLSRQDAKIPHLRFLYDRVGYFADNAEEPVPVINATGFNHGGALVMEMFFAKIVWILDDEPSGRNPYDDLFEFLMGFDTNEFPMYGQQLTLAPQHNAGHAVPRLDGTGKFQRYVQAAFVPENASRPQCNIHYSVITNDNRALEAVITKEDITGPDGHVSPDLVNAFLEKTSASSNFPINFICL